VRITIVGGGPAGLYFGLLMKKQDPRHQVVIFERDAPGQTYGWGIVFSDRTLSFLHESDAPSYESVTRRFALWDNVDVVHRDRKISVRGNEFLGIARITFLNILHTHCRNLDVDLRFHTNVATPDRIAELAPPPATVSREKALALDPETLKHLREELAWTW